jgi:hypothetical protein
MVLKNTGFAEGIRDEGRDKGRDMDRALGLWRRAWFLVIYGGAIATAMSRLGSSGFVAAAGSARIGGSGPRGTSPVLMARCRRTYMAAS